MANKPPASNSTTSNIKSQKPISYNNSNNNLTTTPEEPIDERLANIDPRLIEMIRNEIMHRVDNITWDSIAGLEHAKNSIKEIVVWPMLRPDIFKGLRGPPKGLLLFGPPGTGKTMIGKCIASQAKATFFSISASSLTSKWVGEGEKMVRALFAVARCSQPAVIFIDEIDSLLTQRTDGEVEASRRIKTEFLVQFDGAGTNSEDRILVIGATNRPQEIDEAARRRLLKRLYIPLPESEARATIIRNLLSNQSHCLSEEDIKYICERTDGYSGSDMDGLCREAAIGPIRSISDILNISSNDVRPISRQDFEEALTQVRASVSNQDLELYLDWNQKFDDPETDQGKSARDSMASRGRSNYAAKVNKYRRPTNFDDEEEGGFDGGELGNHFNNSTRLMDEEEEEEQATSKRFAEIEERNTRDEQFGFIHYGSGPARTGWILNMKSTFVKDAEWPGGRSAVDYYFLEDDGSYFRSTVVFSPYFFVRCKPGTETVVEDFCRKRFENLIEHMERVEKEDLEMPNHLSGRKGKFLKLSFRNTVDLAAVRKVLQPAVARNTELAKERGIHTEDLMNFAVQDDGTVSHAFSTAMRRKNPDSYGLNNIVDLREHDLPYHLRVNIDLSIRCGLWYTVTASAGKVNIERIVEKNVRPDPVVFAFDIETSKLPLKFPEAQNDPIMMISYMIDGKGYLVTNRNIVSKDLENFEYTPKPEYQGKFTVFSEADEKAMLLRFFTHIQMVRPAIYVTYNGDSFDWPYIETRAKILGIDMKEQCGVVANSAGEYSSSNASHMDCYRWVKRDSYLPAGSQGLKAVTSAKLGYDPLELDPEEMTDLARTDPQTLANYSVSDAVATYYLYMKYVNPFIFSLCNIIPLTPDEVLRKGSGTLCETLLMAEAFTCNIAMPNKHMDPKERFHNGHLIESETYIGGHVEALESGVFRSDIPEKFEMKTSALEQLIRDLDRALKFSLVKEGGVTDLSLVINYEEVKAEIEGKLREMLNNPTRTESPLIYHLDVAAMYPNIILTNRLQPPAIVDESMCAQCDFNKPGKTCQRKMTWSWRGEFYTAKRSEYRMIKNQIESERFPLPYNNQKVVPFLDLPENERHRLLTKRIAEYSQKVYKRTRTTDVVQKTSIVCQRENSFYVDTVRNFRDRRYDYKALHKQSKKKLDEAVAQNNPVAIEEWTKMHTLYDSLQVAHKCILNSFYGYVMRKGARWYSMEMAGIVCETGAAIIRLARQLVEQLGRPLELDTDGIWCMLPATFPENFTFNLSNGKKHSFAYPCVMLNHLVHDQFTNDQYQTLTDPANRKYAVSSENSIFFEIDGPYRAMILPSSTEEGKLLKKRYAVFADDGKLAELKGFEIKRRGELKMIKLFQSQLFKTFLEGDSLVSCYDAVARVADYWLDILHTKGAHLTDQELFELISENRSMSKSLEDYGEQKSTSISTARRLAEFLGDEMVKEKGLACKFIISVKPSGDPVASRAIPVAIFSAEPEIKRHYLRKWLRDPGMTDFDIRSILDWNYYLERLESVIQKLILIPSSSQGVRNPVPRVKAPDWVRRKAEARAVGAKKQTKMSDLFSKRVPGDEPITEVFDEKAPAVVADIEEMSSGKRVKFSDSVVDNEPAPAVEPRFDMNLDYSGWIASKKAKWRQIRAKIADPALQTTSNSFSTPASIWSRARGKEQILSSTWDVLHIESHPETMGLFNMYVLVCGSVRKICFKRSRKIFVHCKEAIEFPSESFALPLVHFKLPYNYLISETETVKTTNNSLTTKNASGTQTASTKIIYEITADEGDFMSNYQQYSAFMCHPNVLGIYEATVPLEFLNLVSLGTRICIDPAVRNDRDPLNPNFVFGAEDFVPNRIEGSLDNYLSDSLRYLYVYHLHTDNRHVFLLYCSRGISIASALIVDPAGKRQIPNLKTLFSSITATVASQNSSSSDAFDYKIIPEFEVDLVTDLPSAIKLLRNKISGYAKSRSDGPLIGLLSSSASGKLLLNLKSLFTSPSDPSEAPIPLIDLPGNLDGSTVGNGAILPPLDWQRFGLKRSFEILINLNVWINESKSLSRFSQIPFGNLPVNEEEGKYSFIADVFFGRELKQRGYLLPHRLDKDLTASLIESDESVDLEVERSGISENVAVELEMIGFALNCLLQYQSILGPEGAESVCNDTAGLYPILRQLVKAWFQGSFSDCDNSNTISTFSHHSLKLTANFYQWLLPSESTTSSQLITKRSCLFASLQLILRRAMGILSGLTISLTGKPPLLLTSSKLVLITRTRLSIENAAAFFEYFQSQITSRDEFLFIQFNPSKWWKYLIWMDRCNYVGVSEGEEEVNNIQMDWLLLDYLPQFYENAFKKIIQSFIDCLFNQLSQDSEEEEAINDEVAAAAYIGEEDSIPNPSVPNTFINDPNNNELIDITSNVQSSSRYLPLEFTQNFLLILQDLQKITQGNAMTNSKIVEPKRFSLHSFEENYLLDYVKYLGTIFALHPILSDKSVPSLLKQAFTLIGIPEFSDLTIYRSPFGKLKLKNLSCKICGFVQNLDLAKERNFKCSDSNCSNPFDLADIEEALLYHLKSILKSYQRQDLLCTNCRMPTTSALAVCCPTCPNAAKLNLSQSKEMTKNTFNVAKQVAKALKMSTVQHFISITKI